MSLNEYASKCFSICSTAEELAAMKRALHPIISVALIEQSIATKNWATVPIPDLNMCHQPAPKPGLNDSHQARASLAVGESSGDMKQGGPLMSAAGVAGCIDEDMSHGEVVGSCTTALAVALLGPRADGNALVVTDSEKKRDFRSVEGRWNSAVAQRERRKAKRDADAALAEPNEGGQDCVAREERDLDKPLAAQINMQVKNIKVSRSLSPTPP